MKMRELFRKTSLTLLILLLVGPVSAQYYLEKSNIPSIDKMTKNYMGQSLSLRDLDRIVKEISQDGLFQVVYIDKVQDNRVQIKAEQSTTIVKINIAGNVSIRKEEILSKMGIQPGQILSRVEIQQALTHLEQSYRNRGYYNLKVNSTEEKNDEGLILNIEILEQDYCLIENIRIQSKNEKLDTLLQKELHSYLKSNYQKNTSSRIEKKINDLFLKNRYLTAKVSHTTSVFNQDKTRVRLNFSIDSAIQYEFLFHGNHFFSHYDIVRETEVGTNFLYLSDSSSEIIENLNELYRDNGFAKVSVAFSEQYFAKEKKKVFLFEINEGPRISVGKINVSGKISKSPRYYQNLFKILLAEQENTIYFVQKDVENAAQNLVTQLRREGHLQAELTALNVEFNEENRAEINLQIDEGILTYVRQILFRGAKSFSNIQLQEQVEIEPNQPLRIDQVEKSFDKLTSFYKERSYLDFQIQNPDSTVIQYKPGQPYADIVYQIDEGDKVKVKDIQVTGLKKTKEYIVLRELDFKEGDYLYMSRVNNSVRRLERSGLFARVDIRTIERTKGQEETSIVIETDERKPGLFSSGIGLLSEGRLTYRGYLGVLYNNIGGKGRAISGRVDLRYQDDVNYLENRLALAYYEPYIFEDRVRGRLSLIREQQLFDFRAGNSDILSTNELRFSLEKEYSKQFRFTYNVLSFSNQETFNVRDLETRRSFNVGMTGPIFELDKRNDQFLPTDGSYSRFELEFSNPVLGSTNRETRTEVAFDGQDRFSDTSEINFYRASFSTTHYMPLTDNRRWVWVNSIRGGYLKNMSDRDGSGVPRVRSFFLGGSSTIRGFSIGTTETVPGKRELCLRQKVIGPTQSTSDCDFDEIFVRDDSAFFLVKSEIRFPISGNLGGILFYDGGAVYMGEFSLEDPYRDSFGTGLKYDTPVGSFVLQIGYKLDRKTGGINSVYDRESDFAIHLAIGNF